LAAPVSGVAGESGPLLTIAPGAGDPGAEKPDGAPGGVEPGPLRPARILIVEDEALIALQMAMTLGDAGHEVIGTKATGKDTLAALADAAARGAPADLVLMDITLRGDMDGIETVRRIRELHGDLPVVYVTGQADPSTRARAQATRPAAYVVKPVQPDELARAVAGILSRGA
jgi:CheY-like chemotaxis protein